MQKVVRKRKQKKLEKRHGEFTQRLEDFYQRGEEEKLVEAVHGYRRKLTSWEADLYGEAADRVLERLLAAGDLDATESLIERLERQAGDRPLVVLSKAVVLLAEGRGDEAGSRLQVLTEAQAEGLEDGPSSTQPASVSPGASTEGIVSLARTVISQLRIVGGGGLRDARTLDEPTGLRSELRGLVRLGEALDRYCQRPPGRQRTAPSGLHLEAPLAQALWEWFRALTALRARGFRPGPTVLANLCRAGDHLRQQAGKDSGFDDLLDQTEPRVGLLGELARLEESLRRQKGARKTGSALLDRLRHFSSSLKLVHSAPASPLLRSLHYAIGVRWRALVTLVAERDGVPGLADLYLNRSTHFAELLNLTDGKGDRKALERWSVSHALLEHESYLKLARFLQSQDQVTDNAQRLAELWSLELWARKRWFDRVEEDELGQEVDDSSGEPPLHGTLVRLAEMCAEVEARMPEDQRSEVARFLRDELFELYGALYFCSHFVTCSVDLLQHLPGDAGLLVVALASSRATGSNQRQEEVTTRIQEARGQVRVSDLPSVLRLFAHLAADEDADDVVAVLSTVAPLFSHEDWSQILDQVARKVSASAALELRSASESVSFLGTELILMAQYDIHSELESYRPILAQVSAFAALDVALECWQATRAPMGQLRKFYRRFPTLESALELFRVLLASTGRGPRPGEIGRAITRSAHEVIARLDPRWQLWKPFLPNLVLEARSPQVRTLRQKILLFLKQDHLDPQDQESLEDALVAVETRKRLGEQSDRASRGSVSWPEGVEATDDETGKKQEGEARSRKPRRRRSRVDDRQLSFDWD